MRRITCIIVFLLSFFVCTKAQVYELPVFDRSDTPALHVDKVEITKEATCIYCSYDAIAGSWANISKETYLRDVKTDKKYPLIKCEGFPYAPQTRIFSNDEVCEIKLYFHPICNLAKFDLIEQPHDIAFNIYGINLDTVPFPKKQYVYNAPRLLTQRAFYQELKNYKKVISISEEIVENTKYIYGIKSKPICSTLSILSSDYYSLGDINKAINILNEVIQITNIYPDYDISLKLGYLTHLSVYYDEIGYFQKAIYCLTSCLEDVAKVYGEESIEYSETLIKLSKYSNNIGNYSQALQYAEQARIIIIGKEGERNGSYVKCLSNLATAKSNLGDYDEAINTNFLAYNINTDLTDSINIDNAIFLGNISYNYSMKGMYKEAINYGKMACSLFKLHNRVNTSYVNFLTNISYYYFQLCAKELKENNMLNQDYIKEIDNYLDSAEFAAYQLSDNSLTLPQIKNSRANFFTMNRKYDSAIGLLLEACSTYVDKTTIEYSQYLENLALSYLYKGDYSKALLYESETNDIFNNRVKNNLKSIPEFDISNYWNTLNIWYNNYLPKFAYYTKDTTAIKLLFNETALFSKGFLLNSNLNIKEIVYNEGNPENIARLDKMTKLYEELDELSSGEKNAPIYKLQTVRNNIKSLEKKLIDNSLAYKTYLKQIECDWLKIKNSLKKDEIAIEFVKFPLGMFNDSTVYVALSIKNNYSAPHMTHLFLDNEISKKLSSHELYNIIWKPLESEINNVTKIYFSPTGVLYSLGIEYLSDTYGNYISDKHDVYRLSSTRELLFRDRNCSEYHKAVLFGGINYDAKTSLANDKVIYNSIPIERGIVDSLVTRGGFDNLNNTLKEVQAIDSLLKESNIDTRVYSDDDGSEDNFKKISNSNIDIIHISTHGMYINVNDADRYISQNNFAFVSRQYDESSALTRSFLVMSGGNRLPRRQLINPGENDGILTALEISRTNMRHNRLAVLSACQTALGDVNNNGVMGLQRGFKKAGVNTILMSLDKVDDEATRILMVEFYRNLMSGKSKYQSLKDAQKFLRFVENKKYDKPEYWASFILLDGLN